MIREKSEIDPDLLATINMAKQKYIENRLPLIQAEAKGVAAQNHKEAKHVRTIVEQNLLEIPFTIYKNQRDMNVHQIVIHKETGKVIITAMRDPNPDVSLIERYCAYYARQNKTFTMSEGRWGQPIPFDRMLLWTIFINSRPLLDGEENNIRLSFHKVCAYMQLRPSGRTYDIIRLSQRRLRWCNINDEGGWFDLKQKKRVPKEYNILAETASPSREETIWTPSPHVLESFRNTYVKTIDYHKFISLRSPIAQFAYGFILKKIGNNKREWRRNLHGFISDIGCGHFLLAEPKRRNEYIKLYLLKALDELKPDILWEREGENIIFQKR